MILVVVIVEIYKSVYGKDKPELYRNFIGLALGASLFSLFLRISGGIFSKAGDVGSDLLAKTYDRFEYRKRLNPIIMADLSGDVVGDLGGGSVEFFAMTLSVVAGTIAVQSNYKGFAIHEVSFYYTLIVYALAIFVGIVANFIFSIVVKKSEQVPAKKLGNMKRSFYIVLALIMIPFLYLAAYLTIPDDVEIEHGKKKGVTDAFLCSLIGLISALINCLSTEYFCSMDFDPVKEVAGSSETGPATVVIYGLALGYKATVVPSIVLAVASYLVFTIFGFFGFGAAAIGMLAFQSQILVNKVSGPITDINTGLCDLSLLPEFTMSNSKKLRILGKTSNVIAKTFNCIVGCFASLVIYGGVYLKGQSPEINKIKNLEVIAPLIFFGVLIGGMFPFTFTSFIMKAIAEIGIGLMEMTKMSIGGYLASNTNPLYIEFSSRCGLNSAKASIGVIISALLLPLAFGFFLGLSATSGFCVTFFIVSYILAISFITSGASWESAKVYIQNGLLSISGNQKFEGSDEHKAGAIGDRVGDTFKQGAGVSLNSLSIFLSALFLAFVSAFAKTSWLECVFSDIC